MLAKAKQKTALPRSQPGAADESMDRYVREIGVKEAFHMYAYTNLTTQQAENGRSIFKLHMVEALVRASPAAMIKYRYLKACMANLMNTFGIGLFCYFECANPKNIPGKAADSCTVLLNHWRRACSVKKAFERPRKLKENKTDISLDSGGFPAILKSCMSAAGDAVSEADSLDKAVGKLPPPPVGTEEWKGKVFKKPSASVGGGVKKDSKKVVKGKPVVGKMVDDVKLNGDLLLKTMGTEQAYIQCKIMGTKKLIVAVSSKQAGKTTKTHYELVDMLLSFAKQNQTKREVVLHRDSLLKKFAK